MLFSEFKFVWLRKEWTRRALTAIGVSGFLFGASDAFQNLAVLRVNEMKAVQAVYMEEVVAGNSVVTFSYYVA